MPTTRTLTSVAARDGLATRYLRSLAWPVTAVILLLSTSSVRAGSPQTILLENEFVTIAIAADGTTAQFVDKQSGVDYCDHSRDASFASITKAGKSYAATAATYSDDVLDIQFGESGASVRIAVRVAPRYFTFEILAVGGPDVEELSFVNVPLIARDASMESFCACALALNIATDVTEIPGASSTHLRATCAAWPGLNGAKAAIIGCPRSELRNVIKDVVTAHLSLPQTDRGGPWALDASENRGSYLIDFPGSISETTVAKWIATAKSIGAKQIDFHTGRTLRYGDLEPDLHLYPDGLTSVKNVVDALHAEGLSAGLHTYAFFVAKDSKWVSPVPSKHLAKSGTFTLAAPLTASADRVDVKETTAEVSTLTGFQVRNSVTLQIDDELITFSGVTKTPPYAFIDCKRGAHGTSPVDHKLGAQVHRLKECFGLFAPDGDTPMFDEVAARTADVYNQCGFDMIYLDALDGADLLGRLPRGPKYYSGKFVDALCRKLNRPAIVEMSSFDHHLWFSRSRLGAWDAPSKGYKRFIDRHVLDNKVSQQAYLPTNLGWWCVFDWSPKDRMRTFPDDVEYLMCKAIAGDHSLSWLMGFDPDTFENSYNARRLGALVKRYEELRLSNAVGTKVREELGIPGKEFTLESSTDGDWRFRPVAYDVHKVRLADGVSECWSVNNGFSEQPVKVRIEALMSLESFESGETLAAFDGESEFDEREASAGVVSELEATEIPGKTFPTIGVFSAKNSNSHLRSAWAMVGKNFERPVDLRDRGFGLWIEGDGKGEVINFQWRAPLHVSHGVSEHYAVIDFTGWKYFEFVAPESESLLDYGWPYFYSDPDRDFDADRLRRFNPYAATFWVDYGKLDALKIWYNDLPQGEEVKCSFSPIKALRHSKRAIVNPVITVNGRQITFPVALESGCYLEFRSKGDCKVYDAEGVFLRDVVPQGEIPLLKSGTNKIACNCDSQEHSSLHAKVTIISQSDQVIGE